MSVLIIVEYYLALICVMLAVVLNRDRFCSFCDVATRRERFQGFMVSEFARAYSPATTPTTTKGAMFIICPNVINFKTKSDA